MKIKASRKALAKAFKTVAVYRASSKLSEMRRNMLLYVDADGAVFLYAGAREEARCTVRIDEAEATLAHPLRRRIVLPGAYIVKLDVDWHVHRDPIRDILDEARGEDITIEEIENSLHITCGMATWRIPSIDGAKFPEDPPLAEGSSACLIEARDLKAAFRAANALADPETSQQSYRGRVFLLSDGPKHVEIVAADGKCLIRFRVPVELVPAATGMETKAVSLALAMPAGTDSSVRRIMSVLDSLSDGASVRIEAHRSRIAFSSEGMLAIEDFASGRIPTGWREAMATNSPRAKFSIRPRELIRGLNMAREGHDFVFLKVGPSEVGSLFSRAQHQETELMLANDEGATLLSGESLELIAKKVTDEDRAVSQRHYLPVLGPVVRAIAPAMPTIDCTIDGGGGLHLVGRVEDRVDVHAVLMNSETQGPTATPKKEPKMPAMQTTGAVHKFGGAKV